MVNPVRLTGRASCAAKLPILLLHRDGPPIGCLHGERDDLMYRVLTIVGSGLLLTACASSTPNWFNLDALKPAPMADTVQFESEPPGADAKTSTGQTCRTPCSLTLNTDAPFSVTFTLNGYLPESEQIEVISDGGSTKLRPNPVMVELSAAPPVPKKPAPRKKPAAKPKPKPKPAAAAKPAGQPATTAAAPAAAPWPAPQQPAR